MSILIQTQNLTKNYGSSRGISEVSVEINEGEVFGFLGPNGAGKTTTIRTLMGLLRPTGGLATIAGLNCWTQATEIKRLVGYLPSEFVFDPSLTGAQIIEYLGNLRGGVDQTYVRSLLERLGLDPRKRFREYSRGNKQKIGLVQAFMHKPRLLILDEPSSGLDPLNQQEFYTMINEVHAEGRTVFLSSHILPEVEHTCERVGIIRDGRLIEVNEVNNLKHMKQHEIVLSFATPAELSWFGGLANVLTCDLQNAGHELHLGVVGDLSEIIRIAAAHYATNIVTHEPSLEEVFLRFYEPAKAPVAIAK